MDTIFISDVHLSEARPDKISLFRDLLRGPARRAGALYILGDLFDRFWLGNDDLTPPHQEILDELKRFTDAGPPLYILRGNRELMLDQGIESLTGAVLLPDPSLIQLMGKPVLILHGDILCTRDVWYQRYRKLLESAPARRLFLGLPHAFRSSLVHTLAPVIRNSSGRKPPEIMDVDPAAVNTTFVKYSVSEIIHGHTHRPGIHDQVLEHRRLRRIVLGDWYDKELILVCRGDERKLLGVRDYLPGA